MKYLVFTLFLYTFSNVSAQNDDISSPQNSRQFYEELNLGRVNISLSPYNFNDLNSFLESSGFRELNPSRPEYGIGLSLINKHTIKEMDFGIGHSQRIRDTTGLRYLSGETFRVSFNYGYCVLNKKNITLFPYLGLNLANITLRHGTASDSASQWIQGGYQSSRLTGFVISAQPGVGCIYHIYDKTGEIHRLSLYAKAGYNIAANQSTWRVSGMKTQGPNWSPGLLLSLGLAVNLDD